MAKENELTTEIRRELERSLDLLEGMLRDTPKGVISQDSKHQIEEILHRGREIAQIPSETSNVETKLPHGSSTNLTKTSSHRRTHHTAKKVHFYPMADRYFKRSTLSYYSTHRQDEHEPEKAKNENISEPKEPYRPI